MEKQLDGRIPPKPAAAEATEPAENPVEEMDKKSTSQPIKAQKKKKDKPMDAIHDRQDVIRSLDLICSYYKQNEPGSPVPLLLKRARQLVDKSFMEIIQDLVPDSAGKLKTLISGTDDHRS